jgi:hypothetical protein
MPITLTVPEGLLSPEARAEAFAGLTDALLEAASLAGNAFMTANVIGTVEEVPQDRIFAAGEPVAGAFIELKLPQIALATPEARDAFFKKAADVVERAADGRIRREHIWSNIVYAPEGAWAIGGRTYDHAGLIDAIQRG